MKTVPVIIDSILPLSEIPQTLQYDIFDTSVGLLLVVATEVGPCLVTFTKSEQEALLILVRLFPGSKAERGSNDAIKAVQTRLLGGGLLDATPLTFHLKGTDFQIKIWRELLNIPWGHTITYGDLAARIGHPKAFQAVGTAVGANPIFCLVPCHRVIPSNGSVGNYRWGSYLKQLLLDSEK